MDRLELRFEAQGSLSPTYNVKRHFTASRSPGMTEIACKAMA